MSRRRSPPPKRGLHDKAPLETHLALLRELSRLGKVAKEQGLTWRKPGRFVKDSVPDLRRQLTHDDAALDEAFGIYLVDWYLHRVYDGLDGRLSDAIGQIPAD